MTTNIKKGIVGLIILGLFITNVQALTSDGVTYDNKGNTEVLTDTLDGLLRDADVYKTGGTVTANQMLKGATGYAKGELVTGTIESKGAATYKPGTSNQTIGAGVYLSGTQTIQGDANLVAGNIKKGVSIFGVSGTFTSDANAAAGHILSGKTAYVNGTKITGTIPSKGATTYTPGTSNQTINSGQYLSGTQTIAGNANLTAGNIKSGVNIFGVNGTFTSDANAGASDIASGKTAYVNGSKVIGTHTAQDNTFHVITFERYQMNGGNCSIDTGRYTAPARGRLLVYMTMDSIDGGVNNTYSDVEVTVAPWIDIPATSYKLGGEYGKAAYWNIEVEAGVELWAKLELKAPGSNFRSCSLIAIYVY